MGIPWERKFSQRECFGAQPVGTNTAVKNFGLDIWKHCLLGVFVKDALHVRRSYRYMYNHYIPMTSVRVHSLWSEHWPWQKFNAVVLRVQDPTEVDG